MSRWRAAFAAIAVLSAAGCGADNGATPASFRDSGSAMRPGTLNFKVFTAGQTPGFLASAGAFDIASDSAGNMWFTDTGTPAIGRIASDGSVTEFTSGLPAGAIPFAIVAGPDGNIWFSDYRGVALGRITSSGEITEFSASQYTDSNAMGIAFDSRATPWIVCSGVPPLLAHLTKQGKILTHRLPPDVTPDGSLAADASGRLWFNVIDRRQRARTFERPAGGGELVRLTMHMHAGETPCCPNRAPRSMVIGLGGDPWFTTLAYVHRDSPANYLATVKGGSVALTRITHRGLTVLAAYPSGIAAGNGALWISGSDPFASDGGLWRIGANGKQVAYNLPYDPLGLALDLTGHPWFTAASFGEPSQIVEVLTQ